MLNRPTFGGHIKSHPLFRFFDGCGPKMDRSERLSDSFSVGALNTEKYTGINTYSWLLNHSSQPDTSHDSAFLERDLRPVRHQGPKVSVANRLFVDSPDMVCPRIHDLDLQ